MIDFPAHRAAALAIPRLLAILAAVFFVYGAPAGSQELSNLADRGNLRAPDEPLLAEIGIEINQIIDVDQKAENFSAVVTLRTSWQDPLLTYDQAEGEPGFRIMSIDAMFDRANEVGAFVPSFIIKNQQGNRWVNDSFAVLAPDGRAAMFEQSTVTLQAPLFDFTKFPFDRQIFYIELVANLPIKFIEFIPFEEHWGLGDDLGKKSGILSNQKMKVSTSKGLSGLESAHIALVFEGKRHILYYVTRIMIPMLVLIIVSWATFFLDEYRRRIEISSTNLIVFVGFNWVISDSLPKLGYLTFLDTILQFMFVVTGSVVVVNVALSRLKKRGREDIARKIDNYVIKWIYPFGYAGSVLLAAYIFLYAA